MRRSVRALLLLVALYIAVGVAAPLVAHDAAELHALDTILRVPTSIALFSWCKLDSTERDIESPAPAAMLVGMAAPMGIPYYLFSTRSPADAVLGIAKAIGFLSILIAIEVFAGMAQK